MKKYKRYAHADRKFGGTKQLAGAMVAAFICIVLGRLSAEKSIGILPVVLAVVSMLLMLCAAFIFTIDMYSDRNHPMTAIVKCTPAIVSQMLLWIPATLGYTTKTTFLILQNGCQIGNVRLGYYAFMRILVGGMVLCAVYTVLDKLALRHRLFCVVLKICALAGSLCAAFVLTYMCLATQWRLLFPELVVLIVMAVSLLLIWKRAQEEAENN